MDKLRELAYVIIAVIVGLILVYWLGQAIAWSKNRVDAQRIKCVQETNNPYFCQVEW